MNKHDDDDDDNSNNNNDDDADTHGLSQQQEQQQQLQQPVTPAASPADNHNSDNDHNKKNESGQQPPQTQTQTQTQPPPPHSVPSSPFTTTSDVLHYLNTALRQLEGNDSVAASSTTTPSSSSSSSRFELQTRLPDGSSRKATASEQKAADFQSKIQQVAGHVAKLPNAAARHEWAEGQRQYGNQLYREGQYEQAIDVYLTCLTVAKGKDDEPVMFCQVMNNLAQATLKLGWYRKTETFCTMAIEQLTETRSDAVVPTDANQQPTTDREADQNQFDLQRSKLYYQRGKARRLRGEYKAAKRDLESALQLLKGRSTGKSSSNSSGACNTGDNNSHNISCLDTDNPSGSSSAEQRSIERELQLLARAAAEGKRNKERQQRAMQIILSHASSASTSAESASSSAAGQIPETSPETRTATTASKSAAIATTAAVTRPGAPSRSQGDQAESAAAKYVAPLYSANTTTASSRQQRTYSTLRAPASRHGSGDGGDDSSSDDDDDDVMVLQLSHWQWYLAVVGRIAEKLLEWLGDDDNDKQDEDKESKNNQGSQKRRQRLKVE